MFLHLIANYVFFQLHHKGHSSQRFQLPVKTTTSPRRTSENLVSTHFLWEVMTSRPALKLAKMGRTLKFHPHTSGFQSFISGTHCFSSFPTPNLPYTHTLPNLNTTDGPGFIGDTGEATSHRKCAFQANVLLMAVTEEPLDLLAWSQPTFGEFISSHRHCSSRLL